MQTCLFERGSAIYISLDLSHYGLVLDFCDKFMYISTRDNALF